MRASVSVLPVRVCVGVREDASRHGCDWREDMTELFDFAYSILVNTHTHTQLLLLTCLVHTHTHMNTHTHT